ncbi:TrbC/VirB2 family protein [Anaplasma platys]|nr:TrbC/VirB2 family protein [Anaplasma platys]
MAKLLNSFLKTIGICLLLLVSSNVAEAKADDKDVTKQVICNVVGFVQKLGLPIMTGVILGSSVMAIFGRLAWPAIAMLVVFTAIFFGASKLIEKFASGIAGLDADDFECKAADSGSVQGSSGASSRSTRRRS